MKAIWHGAVIAESGRTQVVDGYTYFPRESVDAARLEPSRHTSVCGWKGTANYFDVVVDGERNAQAAWVYSAPKDAARHIAGWIGFWRGVEVVP